MVTVTIVLNAYLQRYARASDKAQERIVTECETVAQLMVEYGFGPGEIDIIIMNGKLVKPSERLIENGEITFYPVFAGG